MLNLNSPEYSVLNWIAILVEHRAFNLKTPMSRKARQYLIDNFSININAYDVIIGYRADDSYFDYAESFLNNVISIEQLYSAMKLGNLGEQIVIKSEYAFSLLQYVKSDIALKEKYYTLRKQRDNEANTKYYQMLEEDNADGIYIRDILKGEIKNDDERIPRNIYK